MSKQYLKTHEWIEDAGEGKYRMGISKYACDQLGDIVFVEAKDLGEVYNEAESLAILESVKAVGDVYAPTKVKLVATNPDLESSPESLSADTWVVEIESTDGGKAIDDIDTLAEEDYLGFLETI